MPVISKLSLTAAALVAAIVASSGPAVAQAATTHSPELSLTRHPTRVPPAPRNRHSRHSSTRARAASWDPTRQVDAEAYCTQSVTGAWSFGTAHPYLVMPTVNGNQSIAFRFNVYRSDGASLGSTDWWEGEVDRSGLFHPWIRGVNYFYYKFMNMRTGDLDNAVGYTLNVPRGLGYRETITVFWYVNGSWSRSLTFAPAWTIPGANPFAYCMG